MPRSDLIDMKGQRFERLVVISYFGKSKWKCKCDCGNERIIRKASLLNGKTKSCGCLLKEATGKRATTHGYWKNHKTEYVIWLSMMRRCYNSKAKFYEIYGGRGIKVCERWHDFKNFLADMGKKPSRAYSLDKKDNDKDYSPENCRWATSKQQMNNRSCCVKIKHDGKEMTVSEWADFLGIRRDVIYSRLKLGWSHERALTEPVASRFH